MNEKPKVDMSRNKSDYGALSSVETSRLLEDSLTVSMSSEQIGGRTLEEMQRQRENLESAREQLTDIKNVSYLANQNINTIRSRVFRRKLYLWSIIIGLFVINMALLIRMLSNSGKIYSIKTYSH